MYIDDFRRCHAEAASRIDQLTYGNEVGWSSDRFIKELGEDNVVGSVLCASESHEMLAAVIFACSPKALHIINLCIHPELTKENYLIVLTKIVDYLKSRLKRERTTITISVRETNLRLQLALASNGLGFKAFKVKRTGYIDTLEDAFLFKYEKPDGVA